MADIFVIEDIEKKVKGMDLLVSEEEVEVIDLGRRNETHLTYCIDITLIFNISLIFCSVGTVVTYLPRIGRCLALRFSKRSFGQ